MKTAALGGCFCFAALQEDDGGRRRPPPSVSFRCRELSHCTHGAPRKLRSPLHVAHGSYARKNCAPRKPPTTAAHPCPRRPMIAAPPGAHVAHGAPRKLRSPCARRPRKLRSEKLRTSETAHDSCAPVRTSPRPACAFFAAHSIFSAFLLTKFARRGTIH